MSSDPTLSVVIPTYNRGALLLDTITLLQKQERRADQILVVDQTCYEAGDETAGRLERLHKSGEISWLRINKASIPLAMNYGLQASQSQYVLFIDDDVEFDEQFLGAHKIALNQSPRIAHVGQIIQPWQNAIDLVGYQPGTGINQDLGFPFNAQQPAKINNCMAGNLCVNREQAIAAGGFDENFIGAAYRFETEFCRRMVRYYEQLFLFEPSASLSHLHSPRGGTRSHADHHTSASGNHSMGDYYFALLEASGISRWQYIVGRFLRSVVARFYLRRPWYIPVRLLAESRGLIAAWVAFRNGPRHLQPGASHSPEVA